MKIILALLIMFAPCAKADSIQDVHTAAHIGTAYAIQTFGYGFSKKPCI
jgi:hypothetical protein